MIVRNLVVASLLLIAPPAFASSTISMSTSGPPYATCSVNNDFGILTFYVVHWPNSHATGASYRISSCNSTLVWVYETFYFGDVTGSALGGVVVDYGACLNGPIVIQTVTYFGDGTSPASAIKVLPHPESASGYVEGVLCGGGTDFPEPGGICIKSAACYCNYLGPPYHYIPCVEPVPVDEATWGSIKALYR